MQGAEAERGEEPLPPPPFSFFAADPSKTCFERFSLVSTKGLLTWVGACIATMGVIPRIGAWTVADPWFSRPFQFSPGLLFRSPQTFPLSLQQGTLHMPHTNSEAVSSSAR
jgi:hypothetical protein